MANILYQLPSAKGAPVYCCSPDPRVDLRVAPHAREPLLHALRVGDDGGGCVAGGRRFHRKRERELVRVAVVAVERDVHAWGGVARTVMAG